MSYSGETDFMNGCKWKPGGLARKIEADAYNKYGPRFHPELYITSVSCPLNLHGNQEHISKKRSEVYSRVVTPAVQYSRKQGQRTIE